MSNIKEFETLLNSYSKENTSDIRSFLKINAPHFKQDELSDIIKTIVKTLIEKESRTLFALYAGIFSNIHEDLLCNDLDFLDLLLFYLNFKLFCWLPTNEIFILTNEERKKIFEIYEILEKWHSCLKKLFMLKNKFETEGFNDYIAYLHEMVQNLSKNDILIIPNGFEKVQYAQNSNSSTLELAYQPNYKIYKILNHSSSIIIKNGGNMNELEFSIVDPLSPYVPILQDAVTEKTLISLNFSQVNKADITKTFLEIISKIKILKPPDNEHYYFSNFYEALLPTINGTLLPINYSTDFYPNSDIGLTKSSILCIKNTLVFLLKERFGEKGTSIFECIWIELNFLFLNEYNALLKINQKLLKEMVLKIAKDSNNLASFIDIKKICKLIDSIEKENLNYLQKRNMEKIAKLKICDLSYKNSTIFALHPELSKMNFILRHLITFKIDSTSLKPHSLYPELEAKQGLSKIFECFNNYIQKCKLDFNLNSVCQIHQSIEDFILFLLFNNLSWEDSEYCSKIEAFSKMMDYALTYYSCCYRITCELYQEGDICYYDPQLQKRLVLTMYSIMIIVHQWCLDDKKIGCLIREYNLPMDFPKKGIIFKEIFLEKVFLPDQKWIKCKNKIISYHQQSQGKSKFLFNNFERYYSKSRFTSDSDKNDEIIIFLLKLIQLSDPGTYNTILEKKFKNENEKSEFWRTQIKNSGSPFTPKNYINFKQISFLCLYSVMGFTNDQIINDVKNNFANLKSWKYSCNYSHRGFKSSLRDTSKIIDMNRSFSVVFPKNKTGYQNLIAKANANENYVLANHREKPMDITKPQYLNLKFLLCSQELAIENLYCSLIHQDLSLDRDEDFYFIKHVLYNERGDINSKSNLENMMNNLEFAQSFVDFFIKSSENILIRINQINSTLNRLFIIKDFYKVSPDQIQKEISEIFKKVRFGVQNNSCSNLKDLLGPNMKNSTIENKLFNSLLSSFCILTYSFQNNQELTQNDVEILLKSRKIISDNFNYIPKVSLPSKIYFEVIQTINIFDYQINEFVAKNPQILEIIFGLNTSDIVAPWSKDDQNIFIKGPYSLVLTHGFLFKNGIQTGRLPQQILNHPDFIEYGGYEFPAIRRDDENFPGTLIKACNFQNVLRNEKDPFIKIWMLDKNCSKICIQEKTCENGQFLTFVPKRYLENNLPLAIIINYKHWFYDNSIFIKSNDIKKETKFEIKINANSGEITSLHHDNRKLVPLENCNRNLQYIFTNFEDKRYILILEDTPDKENYSILFPRLNLHFFCDTKNKYIKSLDYLNYVLCVDQYTTVFENFKNYLIIEPLTNQKFDLKLKQKILIPHRKINYRKSKKYGNVNKWHIAMDMQTFYQPKYFCYEIDENVGRLNSENTSSTIYLALLFYRSAELDKNKLTNLNGWEMSSDVLKSCWQNYLFNEEELRMLLKFFELDQKKIDSNELSKIFHCNHLINDEVLDVVSQNGNSIAICLRVLLLLNSCQQTMLISQHANLNNIINEKINAILIRFVPNYLNLYLVQKGNISKNCLLSKNEEIELLSMVFKNKSNFFSQKSEYLSNGLSKYFNHYSTKEKMVDVVPEKCLDFRSLFHNFISQNALKDINLPETAKNQLETLSDSNFVNIDLQNSNFHCINKCFDCFHFISYYQFALTSNSELFKFFLRNSLLWLGRCNLIDRDRLMKICLLKILYIVNSFPEQFKSILPPKFIFNEDGKINQTFSYYFRQSKYIFKEENLPSFSSSFDAKKISQIKKEIWKIFLNLKLLDQNGIFLRDPKNENWDYFYDEFWMKKKEEVMNSIREILAKENILSINPEYYKYVLNDISKILRTKLVNDFLLIVCEKCQKTKQDFLSKFLDIRINDNHFRITRNWTREQFENELDHQRNELELTKLDESDLDIINWKPVDHIQLDLCKFNSEINNYFESSVSFPEPQEFVLDAQKLPKGCSAELTFNTPYGKMFIDDLQKSFSNSEICEIDNIKYQYQEKPITYQQILNLMIQNLRELINEEFVKNLQEQKSDEIVNNIFDYLLVNNIYEDLLPQNQDRLLIKRFQNIELDANWKEFLIKFNEFEEQYLDLIKELNAVDGNSIILKWNKTEITNKIQPIQDFKTKKKFRNSLRDCEDFEFELEELRKKVKISVAVMKIFTEWSIENKNIKILKYFENFLGSSMKIYQPDETDSKKFKFIESKSIIRPNSPATLCLLERKDCFKEIKILRPATSEVFSGPGYLETEKKEYKLTEKVNISELKSFLLQKLQIYENYSKLIWDDIFSKFHMAAGSEKKHYQLLFLQQIACIQFSLNKFDILRLIDQDQNIDKVFNVQILMLIPKTEVIFRAKLYMISRTLIQQIQRTLLMIFSYENMSNKPQDNDNDKKEVRFLLFQDIAVAILSKRSYDIDEYPMFLLFELENDVLIRNTQTNLLKAMQEKENGVYQMNMGEGKTSVILILLIKILSNPINIIRIAALEPLMGIMHEILKKKFSSLLKKKIFLLPFSRNEEFSYERISKIRDLLIECKEGNHILLMTPEHKLCFQLKLQEIFLDYVQTRNADDKFDWNLHLPVYHQSGSFESERKKIQQILKQIFKELGYIDQNDKIIKFPDFSTYQNEVLKKRDAIRFNGFLGIYDAYDVLKQKSKSFKNSIQNKLEILKNIAAFTYLDILDESDEILRYGKELNYTLGASKDFDGGCARWSIPFKLLNMIFFDPEIGKIIVQGNQLNKLTLDKDWRPQSGIGGGVYFLQLSDKSFFEEKLKPKLAYNILIEIFKKCNKNDSPNNDIVSEEKGSYLQFIMGELNNRKDKSSHSPELIISLALKNIDKNLLTHLLIGKAWLTHGLLYHIISYRYRVNYGLLDFDHNDPKKDKNKEIAIPFTGKDLPSDRSEFSHPEIMIGFTILSYFYNGLSRQQMRKILVQLKSSKNSADIKYFDNCVNMSKEYIMEEILRNQIPYPKWLHDLDKLDVNDEEKLNIIWKYLARNIELIEFYLSSFTFPEKCKFFKKKLTGNSHDISGEGDTKGFSGTDDRNDTMPESIISKRLPDQFGTNGKMLHIISRTVNKTYRVIQANSVKEFLGKVCVYANDRNNRCYLLIDSGAVITEMSNLTAARILLEGFASFFKGVGYFCDETNIVKVILRNGEKIPLSTCPLDKSELFIYLDEVHTRGTDIKFPLTAKGIVTVGKNMSKDKFMQAVMRLRQLDFKQSIEIWGNRDISNEIANVNGLKNHSDLNSSHVLVWVTYNTIEKNLKDLYPVLIEKIKYIVKKRALDYQTKNNNIPIAALIGECEVSVIDELETLYAESPSFVDPMNIVDKKISFIFGEFWTRLEKELDNLKGKLANNNEQLSFVEHLKIDKNRDYEYIRAMVDRARKKLPEKIWIAVGELDSSQENEKEMEEMQIVELAPITVKISSDEMSWKDYNVLFRNFIQECLHMQADYPKIFLLTDALEGCDISIYNKLKWSQKIYITENFKTTVKIDKSKGEYQNEYLRPINAMLFFRDSGSFVCLSGKEACSIKKVLEKEAKKNENVFMMFLNDFDGPTTIPHPINIISEKANKKCFVLLKLFNGECRYQDDEISILESCLGKIKSLFQETNFRFQELNEKLNKSNLLNKGFLTNMAQIALTNKLKLQYFDQNEMEEINKNMDNIVTESIAIDYESLSFLPNLALKLINMRGNFHEYEQSAIYKIIN